MVEEAEEIDGGGVSRGGGGSWLVCRTGLKGEEEEATVRKQKKRVCWVLSVTPVAPEADRVATSDVASGASGGVCGEAGGGTGGGVGGWACVYICVYMCIYS